MPWLSKHYCHSDIVEASDTFIMETGVISVAPYIYYPSSTTQHDNDTGQYSAHYFQVNTTNNVKGYRMINELNLFSCNEVGPWPPQTSISSIDAVEVGWLVALAFAIAYSFKLIRRSL